nr:NADH dehydrogenase subunit 2 [Dypsocus coleoptratus]
MTNNLNILFILLTILGSLISISSSSWLIAWMGLELNMLSFVPLLAGNKSVYSTEAAMKYFIVQSAASALFIFLSIFESFFNFLFFFPFNQSFIFFISIPLLIKLGAAPFHMWFISIFYKLDWIKCFMLMTLQKLTPLVLMMQIPLKNNFIIILSFASLVIGAMGGLTQTLIKSIIAFSSINHLGWMLLSLILDKMLMIWYFWFYLFMNFTIIICLLKSSISHFNQIFNFQSILPWSINFLSLGGLPPFLGFVPKWMIIQSLIINKMLFTSFILIFTTLITLIFYLRLIISAILISPITQKWIILNKSVSNFFTAFMVVVTSLGLILYNFILT